MEERHNKITTINILSALLLQFGTIVSGFVIPRVMLNCFGSETNGLVASISQFLNYITLLEGGVGAVITASLYRPLSQRDYQKLSAVIVTARRFFRKLARVFLLYSAALALIYPLIVRTSFSFAYVSSLTLTLSVALFMQYNFAITWRILLKADRKVYVSSFIDLFSIVLHTVLIVVSASIFPEIHFVRIVSAISYVVQPVIYDRYVTKRYPLDETAEADENAIAQRWDGFGINLAAFLNANTDVITLTLLSTLTNVSIYSVYALVTTGLSSLVKSISAGFNPSLGKAYATGDNRSVNDVLSKFENAVMYCSFCLYTCAALLIVPFVLNYTRGVNDADYHQPFFAAILLLSSLVYCLREPYVNMAYVGNKFHEVSKYAYLEALINVVISVAAVRKFGLNGVAFGTLCSMSYRTIFHILYMRKLLPRYSAMKTILKLIAFTIASSGAYYICYGITMGEGWKGWIIDGCVCALVSFVCNSAALACVLYGEKKYAQIIH